MSSFSSGLKLSMSTGSSNEALCFLLNVFLLKDASTSSGFMPALRHLRWSIKIWHWPLPWGFSPVKPAPLAAPPVGQVYAAVPRALHAAVRLPNASSEEGPAGVASHSPVVEVGSTRTIANAALGGQSSLQSRNYLPLIRWKKTRLSGCQGLTARETDWKSLHDTWFDWKPTFFLSGIPILSRFPLLLTACLCCNQCWVRRETELTTSD